ncbi:hypothetical protein HID58_042632 [Brassica napus]|uniref:Uncharacterized protein n=1 Tax=Brassica napus TaxID=3708 RepID=A0ABQ8BE90_BRANA|nr:hypothetical protein HID58_042632 [Brassica napus]
MDKGVSFSLPSYLVVFFVILFQFLFQVSFL